MATTTEKRREFRRLHESGCFVLPNPWDVGSARYLQTLGFKALATTSAGFAFSRGLPDGGVPRADVLAHVAEMADAVDVPVNADFEGGYAVTPEGVAESVRLCCATGGSGLSIEDSTGDPAAPLHDFPLAVARVAAARKAIDDAGGDVVFTARSEGFVRGRPDLGETIRRLRAFVEAGADCVFAPGIRTPDQIRAIVEAVSPVAVNVVVGTSGGLTVAELAALGVRRISVGGSLARAAWRGAMAAAREIAEAGTFGGFADLPSGADLNQLFAPYARRG
jgi:2-methylisocitrate lyase-like PEP mutase family enzyme